MINKIDTSTPRPRRIAICISGQPRTWLKCVSTWASFIKKLNKKFGAETDIFFHAWDFNTAPHGVLAAAGKVSTDLAPDYIRVRGEQISAEERQQLIDVLNPVSYVFESEASSKSRINEVYQRGKQHEAEHGGACLDWAGSQFYGVMRASHLKKRHEIENNFRYDICFRFRFDLFLPEQQQQWLMDSDIEYPEHNTFYSVHTGKDNSQFPFHRMGDILWYADSVTFDRICDFYRWLPMIGKRSFLPNKLVGTEHSLYFYSKMLRMRVKALSADPKIYRPSDYLEKKQAAGITQGLGGHELI
jgi:hypothetical protein